MELPLKGDMMVTDGSTNGDNIALVEIANSVLVI